MKILIANLTLSLLILLTVSDHAAGQPVTRELKVSEGGTIRILNLSGRVDVTARPDTTSATLTASSNDSIAEAELKIEAGGDIKIETAPSSPNKRIDISLAVPERVKLKIVTREGEVRVSGDLESVEAKTETGTIAADVPVDDLEYDFFWTASRPRFLSDIELEKVKEKSGGKFQLKGKFRRDAENEGRGDAERRSADTSAVAGGSTTDSQRGDEKKSERAKSVELAFTTARGIVLLN